MEPAHVSHTPPPFVLDNCDCSLSALEPVLYREAYMNFSQRCNWTAPPCWPQTPPPGSPSLLIVMEHTALGGPLASAHLTSLSSNWQGFLFFIMQIAASDQPTCRRELAITSVCVFSSRKHLSLDFVYLFIVILPTKKGKFTGNRGSYLLLLLCSLAPNRGLINDCLLTRIHKKCIKQTRKKKR